MENARLVIVFIIVLSALQTQQNSAEKCPENWDPSPCFCQNGTVTCNEVSNINSTKDLEKIFNSPSITNVTKLSTLLITYGNLENVTGVNIFGFFKFEKINIFNTRTKLITGSAIIGQEFLKYLSFKNNQFASFINFIFLKYLNVQEITVEFNSLADFPSNSLAYSSARIVRLAFNKLHTVKKHTFTRMSQLREIDLSGNKITVIEEEAFHLPNLKYPLEIYLNSNNLTIEGIHENAFSVGLRLTLLSLAHNYLTTLPRKIFEPILDVMADLDNSYFGVSGNPFVCDSSLTWLVTKPQSYKNIVRGLVCSNGNKTLDELTEDDVDI